MNIKDKDKTTNKNGSGIGVDRYGAVATDPTTNVKEQLAAAREGDQKYLELNREWNFRYWTDLRKSDLRAQREVRLLEKEIINLHMARIKDAGEKEAERLNDIRAGATQQAARLATDLVSSQELARKLVETTATTLSTSATLASDAINKRLTQLEQLQYTAVGKSGVTDPAFADYMSKTTGALELLASSAERRQGSSAVITTLIIFGSTILTGTIVGTIVYALTH